MYWIKTFVRAVVLVLVLASPAVAQQTIAESSQGRLWWTEINEAIMDSKIADAAKFRVGAPFELDESGGGGAFSFDVIGGIAGAGGGRRVEVVLLTGGMNRNGGGETGLFVTRRGTWGDISDAAQIRIYEATSDAIIFHVPVVFAAGSNGGGGNAGAWPGCMASGVEGDPYRWQFCQQGTDGNVVSYEIVQGQPCARWSAYHGVIPKHTSPVAVCRL